jgi:hypothetical protein
MGTKGEKKGMNRITTFQISKPEIHHMRVLGSSEAIKQENPMPITSKLTLDILLSHFNAFHIFKHVL